MFAMVISRGRFPGGGNVRLQHARARQGSYITYDARSNTVLFLSTDCNNACCVCVRVRVCVRHAT